MEPVEDLADPIQRAKHHPSELFRYRRPSDSHLAFLSDGHLWFSDPSKFNDPFEMMARLDQFVDKLGEKIRLREWCFQPPTEPWHSYNQRNAPLTKHTDVKTARRWAQEFKEDTARRYNVVCFSTKHDDTLMWSHYAKNHTGFCIGFSGQHSFFVNRCLGPVVYNDTRILYETQMPIRILFWKAKAWEYESEWRLVMPVEELTTKSDQSSATAQTSARFLLTPWDTVSSIYFGVYMEDSHRQLLWSHLNRPDRQHIRVYQMHLSTSQFAVESERLR